MKQKGSNNTTRWQKAKDFTKGNLFLISGGVGISSFLWGYAYNLETAKDIGNMLVISGFFGAFTRWLSFSGFMRDELEKILYGRSHLEKPENFDKTFDLLIDVAVEENLPQLKDQKYSDFLKRQLPNEGELFYSSFYRKYDFDWENKERRIVKVVEHTEITIETNSGEAHMLPYYFDEEIYRSDGPHASIEELKVEYCGDKTHNKVEDHLDKIKTSIENSSIKRRKLTYEIEVGGVKKYKLTRCMTSYLYLNKDPLIIVGFKWNTLKPQVTVRAKNGVTAYFRSTGTEEPFETKIGSDARTDFEETYPGLLKKRQGYVMGISSDGTMDTQHENSTINQQGGCKMKHISPTEWV